MAVEELGIKTSSVPSRRHSVPSFSCRGHGSIYKDGQKVIWEERPPGLIIITKILRCALLFVSQMGQQEYKMINCWRTWEADIVLFSTEVTLVYSDTYLKLGPSSLRMCAVDCVYVILSLPFILPLLVLCLRLVASQAVAFLDCWRFSYLAWVCVYVSPVFHLLLKSPVYTSLLLTCLP